MINRINDWRRKPMTDAGLRRNVWLCTFNLYSLGVIYVWWYHFPLNTFFAYVFFASGAWTIGSMIEFLGKIRHRRMSL